MKDTATRRKRLLALLPAATLTTACAVTLAVVAAAGDSRTPVLPVRPVAQLLTPFPSCNALLHDVRAHAGNHLDAFTGGPYRGSSMELAPDVGLAEGSAVGNAGEAASAGSASTPQTSGTNVQEAGVDEPDQVKTDGGKVIAIADGRLRVIDAGTRRVTGSLDLRGYADAQGAQLLAAGGRAIVLMKAGAFVQPFSAGGLGGRPLSPAPGGSSTPTSTVLFVDLHAAPKITGSMQVTGTILDARMVGSTARVVASTAPRLSPPVQYAGQSQYRAALRSRIDRTPVQDWLPAYTLTTPSGSHSASVACSAVSHPADYTASSMLTIYTVDPSRPGADPRPVSLAADGDTVYATASSLYIASNPNCGWCFGAQPTGATTAIHRFDISGSGKPVYTGSGTVTGSLLSQYSLSDYKGALRVATTVTDTHGDTVSGVDVLDATTLKQLGSVSGLGRGERVYAVRFLDAHGYVVTYNQQDPLYVLDLSTPSAPRLVGSLEIPGFSSYLHDVGGGRLLGVGQDTTLVSEGGGEYAHNEGRMVQLFDVRNAAHPTRTDRVVLPGTGTPGDPSFDPHAFLYWPQTGLVVVPVSNYGGGVLAVRLDGSRLRTVGTLDNSGDAGGAIQRSMVVDGDLWTFSAGGVRVSAQSDLHQLSWIPFA